MKRFRSQAVPVHQCPMIEFSEAMKVMDRGGMVRRRSWASSVRGIRCMLNPQNPEKAFVLMESSFGTSRWTPYFADFLASDWEVRREPKDESSL